MGDVLSFLRLNRFVDEFASSFLVKARKIEGRGYKLPCASAIYFEKTWQNLCESPMSSDFLVSSTFLEE